MGIRTRTIHSIRASDSLLMNPRRECVYTMDELERLIRRRPRVGYFGGGVEAKFDEVGVGGGVVGEGEELDVGVDLIV